MPNAYYVEPTVLELRKLHKELVELDYGTRTIKDCLAEQAVRLFEAHGNANRSVTFHLACWCKDTISMPAEEIMQYPFTHAQMQQTIASEYGFENWAAVEALGTAVHDKAFEQSVDALITGELKQLQSLLNDSSSLATQRSQYGHRSTLLHYLGANGVESHRQITPYNACDIARCLLEAGADVNAEATMYGGGSRVLGLVQSSAHPHNAGVVEPLVTLLESYGAV